MQVANTMTTTPRRREANPNKKMIGDRIAKARQAIGMSQYEFADAVGVTAGAVGQWEIGYGQPKRDKEETVAEVLGVSVEWLLHGIEDTTMKAETKSEKTALRLMRQLPPSDRREILDLIKDKARRPN